PHCGKHNFTDIREFNLMFQTFRGVTNDSKSVIYLRPENAQGEYVNYLNVQRTMRAKLPFSIGQIGKAFRNEITPGNFTFRTIEFEQMEFQTFCKEGTDSELYDYFKEYGMKYYQDLGINPENLRFHDHEKLAHYAKAACDIEFLFPFGWGEVNGTHNRTNFDLTRHQEYSGQKMDYLDPETNEKYIPFIIESTYGLDRTVLALLCEAYDEEVIDAEKNDTRVVLHLSPAVAPFKAAVLPLSKKLSADALKVYEKLQKKFMVDFDETGSIGKRYRREDEIGTPICITFDFDSLEDNCVTVRDRDTMQQERISIDALEDYIAARINF
ncbi:MAG: glycine--tRNA ligase, partial [Clostridia bacterium]|nr:glycine--tRNA ligase [Clostridia bacterium]